MFHDAIELLEDDHAKLRQLLKRLEATTDRAVKTRQQLFEDIAIELEAHTAIEEEIFYPAYREAVSSKEDRKLYFEAHEEHHLVDLTVAELRETEPDSEAYSAKAKVLKDLIEHHAEEEEKEMFPKARQALGMVALWDLGRRMSERKDEVLSLEAWAQHF
jgi:hemerythrin-like domain-containing protein